MPELIAAWLGTRSDDVAPTDPATAAWVLNVAVESVSHALLVDRSVDADAALDELTATVERYLER